MSSKTVLIPKIQQRSKKVNKITIEDPHLKTLKKSTRRLKKTEMNNILIDNTHQDNRKKPMMFTCTQQTQTTHPNSDSNEFFHMNKSFRKNPNIIEEEKVNLPHPNSRLNVIPNKQQTQNRETYENKIDIPTTRRDSTLYDNNSTNFGQNRKRESNIRYANISSHNHQSIHTDHPTNRESEFEMINRISSSNVYNPLQPNIWNPIVDNNNNTNNMARQTLNFNNLQGQSSMDHISPILQPSQNYYNNNNNNNDNTNNLFVNGSLSFNNDRSTTQITTPNNNNHHPNHSIAQPTDTNYMRTYLSLIQSRLLISNIHNFSASIEDPITERTIFTSYTTNQSNIRMMSDDLTRTLIPQLLDLEQDMTSNIIMFGGDNLITYLNRLQNNMHELSSLLLFRSQVNPIIEATNLLREINFMQFEPLFGNHSRTANDQRGLQKEELNNFPVTIHQSKKENTSSSSNEANSNIKSCVICLCDFENGELIRNLPCTHGFHKDCIDNWLTQKGCCPICRRNCASQDLHISQIDQILELILID